MAYMLAITLACTRLSINKNLPTEKVVAVAKCFNEEIATCVIKYVEFSVGCIIGFIHSPEKYSPLKCYMDE